MPACIFEGEEVERFVLFQRTAKREAALYARIRRIFLGRKWIHCLDFAVTQITERGAVESIGSGASYDVDNAARSPSIFRGIAIGDDLKLLDCLLRNG